MELSDRTVDTYVCVIFTPSVNVLNSEATVLGYCFKYSIRCGRLGITVDLTVHMCSTWETDIEVHICRNDNPTGNYHYTVYSLPR